jgi:hypothetical protein
MDLISQYSCKSSAAVIRQRIGGIVIASDDNAFHRRIRSLELEVPIDSETGLVPESVEIDNRGRYRHVIGPGHRVIEGRGNSMWHVISKPIVIPHW